ncbi:MAG: type VI secretion system protein TssA [Campylobacterota bacterium]|nr:type VI secretion system protein TssA [Campylobacterota bacterium]
MNYEKLGITPIDEQNPAGEDVKYDEDFELIEAQISKLTSPSAASAIDWDIVSKLSYKILETKSKNILVSVYLSYALFKLRGIEGLVDSVKIVADMLENYWEIMYPPKRRLKGRVNAIEWWLGRISKDLENLGDVDIQSDAKTQLIDDLKRVDDFLNEKLEDAPLFYNLIKLLDMKLITPSEVIQEEIVEDVAQKIEQKKTTTPKSYTPSSALSGDVEDDFKTSVNTLSILTGQMIESKDYRAELFMINRAFAWLDIEEVPSSEKSITMLPPPDTQEIELLNTLYKEKNYEALLWAAESRITTYYFWLDLHYYVAESLTNLSYHQASHVVYEQVSFFIKKLPNLQNLSFLDSTPFAKKATKKWLKSKELKKETASGAEENRDDSELDSIDKLNLQMNSCISVEDEVFYNIKICEFLLKNPNETLIYTYLEKLLSTIKRYKTQRWNPDIALKAYLIGVECLSELDSDTDSELLNSLLKKIALLKPSEIT